MKPALTALIQHPRSGLGRLGHPKAQISLLRPPTARLWGHTAYSPFIILSRSRTGSSWLISLLDSHPQVSAQGEIFRYVGGVPPRALAAKFFSAWPRRIKAVGCKVFYYHPLDGSPEELQVALRAVPGMRVIHLKRRNILRTIISRKLAVLTGNWETKGPAPRPIHNAFTLDPDELESKFQQTQRWEDDAAKRFGSGLYFELAYEDVRREYSRLLDFLRLPYHTPTTTLREQNPEPLAELVTNFASLKQRFANTQWGWFFDE